jgi:phage-related protein
VATEVGTAFVTIIPSARGFARRLQSELAHEIRQAIGGTSEREGDRAGREFGQRFSRSAGIGLRDLSKHVRGVLDVATGALTKLGGIPILIGVVATAVAGLASAAAAAVPTLLALGAAIVTASGAAVAIPGALALAGIAVGTLRLGLVGIEDAFKALAGGDAKEFAESLKGLAPNARRTLLAIQKLKPAFDRLRLNVQQRLFEQLGLAAQRLGRAYFPDAERAGTRLAGVFNGALRSAIDVLLSRQTRIDLRTVLNAAVGAAGNLAAAVRPVVTALRDILVVGAQATAELTQGIGAAIGGFAQRISDLRASGGLRQIIDDGLAVLREFGELGKDVLGILRGIFTAAGGAGAAGGKGEGGIFSFFERLNQLVNRPDVQKSITAVFNALADIGVALTPVLVTLAKALGPVAKGIAEIAVAFAPGLQQVAEALGAALAGLAPAIVALAPALAEIARGLTPLGGILADLITGAAPGVTALIAGLASALETLGPAAGPVGRALADIAIAVAPLLPLLGASLANALVLIATLVSELAVAFGPLIEVFATGMTDALRVLAPVLSQMAQAILPLLAQAGAMVAQAFAPLMPVFKQLAIVIATQLAAAMPQFVQMFAQLLPVIKQMLPPFVQFVGEVLKALIPVLPELTAAGIEFALALTELFVAVSPLIPVFSRLLSGVLAVAVPFRALNVVIKIIIGLLSLASGQMRTTAAMIRALLSPLSSARSAFSGFGSSAGAAVRTALSLFAGLPGRIRSAVGSLSGLLVQAGRNVINGLISGIRSRIGALASVASSMASTIRNYLPFSPAKTGPLAGRGNPYYSGKAIVRLVSLGISRNLRYARQASDALAEQFTVSNNLAGLSKVSAAAVAGGFGTAPSPPVGPVYVSAQFGTGPVYDLVEGVMMARPQAVANATQAGSTQLARR